jgi:hypothetical protein
MTPRRTMLANLRAINFGGQSGGNVPATLGMLTPTQCVCSRFGAALSSARMGASGTSLHCIF